MFTVPMEEFRQGLKGVDCISTLPSAGKTQIVRDDTQVRFEDQRTCMWPLQGSNNTEASGKSDMELRALRARIQVIIDKHSSLFMT